MQKIFIAIKEKNGKYKKNTKYNNIFIFSKNNNDVLSLTK